MKLPEKGHKKSSIIIIVAVIILAVALIIYVQPRPREVREAYGSYSLNSSMQLVDQLRNNSLYGNNASLQDPSVIYNNISKDLYVIVDISYFNSQNTGENIDYSYSVYVISSSPSWEKLVYHTTDKSIKATSNYSDSFITDINLTSNITQGSYINRELGFTSASYSVEIESQAVSPQGSSSSSLTISIGEVTDSVTGPSDVPLSGSYFRDATIPGKVIIPLERDVSYPLFLAAAILLGYTGYLMKPAKIDSVTKFKKDNRENLIELASGPSENAVQVGSTDDLFKMAAFVERPVFIFNNIIFVEIDGKTYYAEIK